MTNKKSRVHTKPEEVGVFWIPADTDIPMEYKLIRNDFRSFGQLVDGYMEIVRTEFMPILRCGCQMVMVVNEDGHSQGLEQNVRAQVFYPFNAIVGDVFLIGEGPINSSDGVEIDMVSLPPEFNDWEGPGSPIPGEFKVGG